MNVREFFSRAGAFIAWLVGFDRPPPPEPIYSLLYEAGREGFLAGGLDWNQAAHHVILQDDASPTKTPEGVYRVETASFPATFLPFVEVQEAEDDFDEDTGVYNRRR